MNEIERILNKGIISRSYLKEEIKGDFLIDSSRKKLCVVLLDLLFVFDEVCKRHNLQYFLFYGTLLGAVRHKGFIPWDDDIDVAMPREDYEAFLKLTNDFKPPYFLQTPYTDPGYFYTFAKIRNSNTTGVVQLFENQTFNHGIWLSIFPLDRWDDNGGFEKYERIRRLATDCSTYMRINNPNLGPKDRARVETYRGNPLKDYEEIQRLAQSCKNSDSKYVMTAVITQGRYDQKLLDAADFKEPISMVFEGLEVSVPCGYDHLLRVWYDDYMQLPPKEERGIWHSGTVFDADIPYMSYLHNKGIIV